MPLLLAVAALLLLFLVLVLSIPLTIIQRYRQGTKRRRARGWIVTLNLFGVMASCVMFLTSAAIISLRDPRAFGYALLGMAIGGILGFVGLAAARWEDAHEGLHYTPSRLLILAISLVVTVRIGYGFYRAWHLWGATGDESWLVAAGVANSLAFGAVVLGYYLTFLAGVRGRLVRSSMGSQRRR